MSVITTNTVLALVCFLAVAHFIGLSQGNPLTGDEELLPMEDGSLFLSPNECAEDETPSVGKLPECEPTCKNPRPICLKIFYSGLDVAPCFCKAPLVRNEQTKACVRLEDCPKEVASHRHHKKED